MNLPPTHWEWVPCRSVGPILFNQPIPVALQGSIVKIERWEGETWDDYEVQSPHLRFSVEEGVINSVEIWSDVIFQGVDLIGLTAAELQRILDCTLVVKDVIKETTWRQLNCDELGLIMWEADGVVESLTLYSPSR